MADAHKHLRLTEPQQTPNPHHHLAVPQTPWLGSGNTGGGTANRGERLRPRRKGGIVRRNAWHPLWQICSPAEQRRSSFTPGCSKLLPNHSKTGSVGPFHRLSNANQKNIQLSRDSPSRKKQNWRPHYSTESGRFSNPDANKFQERATHLPSMPAGKGMSDLLLAWKNSGRTEHAWSCQ